VARKPKQILLSIEARKELEDHYKRSESHCFRQRCKMVLLKSDGHSSKEVAAILCTNNISVHNWLKRYVDTGIGGLKTKAGQGRKPILEAAHLSIVRAAVEQERQRLSQARQIVEENIGRKMSSATLTRFLKVITAVTNG
jgi:transposase